MPKYRIILFTPWLHLPIEDQTFASLDELAAALAQDPPRSHPFSIIADDENLQGEIFYGHYRAFCEFLARRRLAAAREALVPADALALPV